MAARIAPPIQGLQGREITIPRVSAPTSASIERPAPVFSHGFIKPPDLTTAITDNNNSGARGAVWRKSQWSYETPVLRARPVYEHTKPPTGVGRKQPVGLAQFFELPIDAPVLPLPDNFDVKSKASAFVPYN